MYQETVSGELLVNEVHAVIRAVRPDLAELFMTRFIPSMFNRPGRKPLDNLNSFWQDQLSGLEHQYGVPTTAVREYLCPSNSPTAWLEHFTQWVLPVILEHNLPYSR